MTNASLVRVETRGGITLLSFGEQLSGESGRKTAAREAEGDW